jgi:hypothetical protein
MSENVVARLRELIRNDGMTTPTAVMVDVSHLTAMLDIVEAVAAYDCPPDPEAGWGFCMYCAADTESEPLRAAG